MKYLPSIGLPQGKVGIATSVYSIVRYDDQLKHVVVKGQGHLVERINVLVQRWNRKDIRLTA